ncbi:4a-hydroxytetrahydrobiopterin dehydratase [Bacteroidota bacterium]
MLKKKKCVPCEGGIPPLKENDINKYKEEIKEDWLVENNHILKKTFYFVNFKQTMDVVNKIAELAENEGHHPVMHVRFGKLEIYLWTHAIDGLSENDFILAAKIDDIV